VIGLEVLVQAMRFYIYITENRSRTLYIGVTNDIPRRMHEHRHHLVPGFTSKYKIQVRLNRIGKPKLERARRELVE
jgi:predicted GIY-YIG superfamily endonuclease